MKECGWIPYNQVSYKFDELKSMNLGVLGAPSSIMLESIQNLHVLRMLVVLFWPRRCCGNVQRELQHVHAPTLMDAHGET